MSSPRSVGAVGLLVVALTSVVGAAVDTAAADCVGPQVSYDAVAVSPGQVVRVTGEHWGTDCYDTGDPPRGVGALGAPQAGIEVVVLQDGIGPVVAAGAADDDYRFVVDVPIPGPLGPGPVTIAARAPSPPRVASGPELAVVDPAAVVAPPAGPAPFGPPAAPGPAPSGDPGLDRWWLVGGIAAVAVAASTGLWLRVRSRQGPRSHPSG